MPILPNGLGFLVEARLAPGGGIDQRLDFDDVRVVGEGSEVTLCGGVALATTFRRGSFGKLWGEIGRGKFKPTYISAGR